MLLNMVFTIQDKDYNIIFQNLASRRFYPASHGEKCYKVYEQRDEICEGCPVKAAYEDGQSHTCERKSLLPSGEVAYWENTANLIRNSKGEITACLEVTRNITEHKRIGEALRKEKEFTDTALDSQVDTFFLFEISTGQACSLEPIF